MTRTLSLTVALLLLLVSSVSAQQGESASVELDVRYWTVEPSGTLLVIRDELGTVIDLDEDLGLQDTDSLEGRLSFRTSRWSRLRIAWTNVDFGGDQVVSRTLEFGGQIFDVSARVVSSLDFDYARLGWIWQPIGTDDGRFRFGPLLEVKGFQGEAGLAAPDFQIPLATVEDFEVAFGSLGAVIDAELGTRVRLQAEASILVGEDQGDILDTEAALRIVLTDAILATVGYRSVEFDVQDEQYDFDFDLSGVFYGLVFQF